LVIPKLAVGGVVVVVGGVVVAGVVVTGLVVVGLVDGVVVIDD